MQENFYATRWLQHKSIIRFVYFATHRCESSLGSSTTYGVLLCIAITSEGLASAPWS